MQTENLLFKLLPRTFKKLVSVLTIFLLMTKAGKKNNMILKRVSYIYYPVWFKKEELRVLINSGTEINTVTLVYTLKLG